MANSSAVIRMQEVGQGNLLIKL